MNRYGLCTAALLACSMTVGSGGTASADSASASDAASGTQTVSFGNVCQHDQPSKSVVIAVTRTGDVSTGLVFAAEQNLAVTGVGTPGLAVDSSEAIVLGADWEASIGAVSSMTATVTFDGTASIGSYSGGASFRVSGVRADGMPLSLSRFVYVTAEIEDCGDPEPDPDVVAPTLDLPSDIVVGATGSDGTLVAYTATAVDDVDDVVGTSCDHASGSMFPIGDTTVTCTASDSAGNVATGSFEIGVRLDVDGFAAPVRADGMNSVRRGSTVPLKFSIRTADGTLMTDPALVEGVTVTSIAMPGVSVSTADFAVNVEETQFVLPVKVPSEPGTYEIAVALADGSTIAAWFEVR